MKIRHAILPCFILLFLASPLLTVAQQAPPQFQARPLRSAPPGGVTSGRANPSTDARVLELAERFKAVLEQVREANPAVLPESSRRSPSLSRLQQSAAGPVEIRMRHNTGTPRFIQGRRLEPGVGAPSGAAAQSDIATARNFLRTNRELLRLKEPDLELHLSKSEADDSNRRHLRFEQRHQGRRVWPAEIGIHLDQDGSVYLMTGAYVPTPDIALAQTRISRDDAISRARIRVKAGPSARASEPELIVYAPGERTPRLAWKLDVRTSMPENWLTVVDAENGRILTCFNQVTHPNVAGSGVDLFGQVRSLNVWEEGGTYFLADTSKPSFDPSSNPPNIDTTVGGLITVDAQNQPPNNDQGANPPLFHVQSNSPTGFNVPSGVSAAFNVSLSYDYFSTRHGRNSFDGNGRGFPIVVRFGVGFENAFFDHSVPWMVLGDGDTYAGSLDVVAHEIAHGVTGTTAGLIYQFQSGALNEGFSDIFGEMAEANSLGSNDWILGTSLSTPFRNMANPGALQIPGLGPYPSKMSEFYNLPIENDRGGVHINSSILNRCYYLLTEGLQGAIGRQDAERIFFRALTVYLMQNSQFVDARLAAVQSANDLFGNNSTQTQRTAAAFDAVEVFDSGGTPPPPDTPPVGADDSTLFVYGNQSIGFLLARREAALNDPVEGVQLGGSQTIPRPPAVDGSGNIAVYVTFNNDISLVRTDGQGEQVLGFPGLVHSVSISPNGELFGFVLRANGQPDNFISVIDVVTPGAQPVTYELRAPGNDGGSIGTIAFADAMAFTASGRYLIYDALNIIQGTNGNPFGIFSIYFLELASGTINSLVPPVEGYDIGNPSISKTNDNFMTFEAFSQTDGNSTILTADLNSGNIIQVGSSTTLGFPSYTGADSGIVYAQSNPNAVTGIGLLHQAVGADRQTPNGEPTVWLLDGGFPFMYRRGTFVGPPVVPATTRLANISTRMRVLTGDNVLIGGFIITGNDPKRVIIRGIGPSLNGVGATLANPTLSLQSGSGTVATNNNWRDNPQEQAEIEATGIPPTSDLESAIVRTLTPGAYTAILADSGGATGVGLVEVYDLGPAADSRLANISTRGFVDTGDNVMIGGMIVQAGQDSGIARVLYRAIGPSLPGVAGSLQDPTLALHNGDGTMTASNDNWKLRPDGSSQQAEIQATTIPPSDDRESAILAALAPGNYTAIVRGANGTTGIAVVEAYNLQ